MEVLRLDARRVMLYGLDKRVRHPPSRLMAMAVTERDKPFEWDCGRAATCADNHFSILGAVGYPRLFEVTPAATVRAVVVLLSVRAPW